MTETAVLDEVDCAPVRDFLVSDLRPYERNARKHSKRQMTALVAGIRRFGFNVPVGVWQDGMLLAGHGRWEAAKEIGLETIPGVDLSHMSLEEARAYCLADNRIADMARWDDDILKAELGDLQTAEVDLTGIGFSDKDLAKLLDSVDAPKSGKAATKRTSKPDAAPARNAPDAADVPNGCSAGDVWLLGKSLRFEVSADADAGALSAADQIVTAAFRVMGIPAKRESDGKSHQAAADLKARQEKEKARS